MRRIWHSPVKYFKLNICTALGLTSTSSETFIMVFCHWCYLNHANRTNEHNIVKPHQTRYCKTSPPISYYVTVSSDWFIAHEGNSQSIITCNRMMERFKLNKCSTFTFCKVQFWVWTIPYTGYKSQCRPFYTKLRMKRK